ncbi:MAG: hypothetical protein ACRC2R_18300 [Xenococcaceae cyanobacterium]
MVLHTFSNVGYTDRARLRRKFPPKYCKSQGNLEISIAGLKFQSSNQAVCINRINRIALRKPPKLWIFAVQYGSLLAIGFSIAKRLMGNEVTPIDLFFNGLSGALFGFFWWLLYFKQFYWIVIDYPESGASHRAYFWVRGDFGIGKTRKLFATIRQTFVDD